MAQKNDLGSRSNTKFMSLLLEFVYRIAQKDNKDQVVDIAPFIFVFTRENMSYENLTILQKRFERVQRETEKKIKEKSEFNKYGLFCQSSLYKQLMEDQEKYWTNHNEKNFLSKARIFLLGEDDLINGNHDLRAAIYQRIEQCKKANITEIPKYDFFDIDSNFYRVSDINLLGNFLLQECFKIEYILKIALSEVKNDEMIQNLQEERATLDTDKEVLYKSLKELTAPYNHVWPSMIVYSGKPFLRYTQHTNLKNKSYTTQESINQERRKCTIRVTPDRLIPKGEFSLNIYTESRIAHKKRIHMIDQAIKKLKNVKNEKENQLTSMKKAKKNEDFVYTVDKMLKMVTLNKVTQKMLQKKVNELKKKYIALKDKKEYQNIDLTNIDESENKDESDFSEESDIEKSSDDINYVVEKPVKTLQELLIKNELGQFFHKINEAGCFKNDLSSFFEMDKKKFAKLCDKAGIKYGHKYRIVNLNAQVYTSSLLKRSGDYDIGKQLKLHDSQFRIRLEGENATGTFTISNQSHFTRYYIKYNLDLFKEKNQPKTSLYSGGLALREGEEIVSIDPQERKEVKFRFDLSYYLLKKGDEALKIKNISDHIFDVIVHKKERVNFKFLYKKHKRITIIMIVLVLGCSLPPFFYYVYKYRKNRLMNKGEEPKE